MSNRRQFLRSAAHAGLATTLLRPGWSSAAELPSQKDTHDLIVDTHMHVWINDPQKFPFAHPYTTDYQPPAADGTLPALVEDMDQNGVTHAILVQTICHGWDNRYTAHCVRTSPQRLRGHGLIDPLDPNVADRLAYWIEEQGLSGMRFSPIYYRGKDDWLVAAPAQQMWKRAAALGAVLNFYIGTEQLPKLEIMVREHPEVPTIIDHVSQIDLSVPDPLPEMKKLLALARHPNVYVKISELTSVSKSHEYPFPDAMPWVKMVYDAFGPSRLLWGTGYPGKSRAFYKRPTLAEELALVREKIPFFTPDDQRKILGENAARLWKLTA
jgi:L-fuconolactonase